MLTLKGIIATCPVKNLTGQVAIIPPQSTVEKNGFWQSDRYFKDVSNALIGLDDFLNDQKISPHAQSTGQVAIFSC